jgi:hypothetical protein
MSGAYDVIVIGEILADLAMTGPPSTRSPSSTPGGW